MEFQGRKFSGTTFFVFFCIYLPSLKLTAKAPEHGTWMVGRWHDLLGQKAYFQVRKYEFQRGKLPILWWKYHSSKQENKIGNVKKEIAIHIWKEKIRDSCLISGRQPGWGCFLATTSRWHRDIYVCSWWTSKWFPVETYSSRTHPKFNS